ncbi:PHB depolymerase family esterase [Corynebacterium kroppenstedtii]
MIFAFHGHSQNAALMEKYTDLDRLPALVVYPQGEKDKSGTQRAWESVPYATTNGGDKDSQLVRDILAQLDRKYRIDHTRIYATGKSNGGGFAAKLACTMPGDLRRRGARRWCLLSRDVHIMRHRVDAEQQRVRLGNTRSQRRNHALRRRHKPRRTLRSRTRTGGHIRAARRMHIGTRYIADVGGRRHPHAVGRGPPGSRR